MPQVQVIEPVNAIFQYAPPKLRVCAYARVSSDSADQLNSFSVQMDHYQNLIAKNEEWELADVYADEGITGTRSDKREEFQRMLSDCRKGKIDLILVKSVSRFARNIHDCLAAVRELKALGIEVEFEEDGLKTADMHDEMIIGAFSAIAQEESTSISNNMRWSYARRMQNGSFTCCCAPYGYDLIDGILIPNPKEAPVVRRIFAGYLSGKSMEQIADQLNADGIPCKNGEVKWLYTAISYILKSERYIGDALLQKTYVVDCITKETRKNNGEIPQYYVTGNHEPIISRDLFNLVQEEIARRAGKRKVAQKAVKTERGKYSSKYALTELLSCGDCGTQYRRVTWARGGKKKVVWRCINRLEYGTKYCKESPTLEESRLHTAIVAALNCLDNDKLDVMETLRAGLQLALGTQEGDSFNEGAIQNRIAELQSVMMDLVELSSKSSASADYFDAKFEEISTEIKSLQEQLGKHKQQTLITQNTKARIGELLAIMEQLDLSVKEYRDDVVRAIIAKVVVLSADRIRVTFDGGVEMEMELPGE